MTEFTNEFKDVPTSSASAILRLLGGDLEDQLNNELVRVSKTACPETFPALRPQHPASHRTKKNSTSPPSTPPSALISPAGSPVSHIVKNDSTS